MPRSSLLTGFWRAYESAARGTHTSAGGSRSGRSQLFPIAAGLRRRCVDGMRIAWRWSCSSRASLKDQLWAELQAALSAESRVRRDEPLAKRTTMRVGGTADFYVEPGSEADLAALLRFCDARHLSVRMLGRGSNVVIRDGGFGGWW